MPMKHLDFKPGVNVELSASKNAGGWSLSNLIRWRSGLAEVILGFAEICNIAVTGVARAMHYWSDLMGIGRYAIGTTGHLYIELAGSLYDITPAGFTPGNASSGSTPFSLLVWSLDNFGQNLIAVASGQGLFTWVPPDVGAPAVVNAAAPAQNNGVIVLDQIQIILAWGSTPIGAALGDPMLLRWCDQSDDTDWIASTTNQAGSYRLPHGSRIIAGLQVPGMALIWTDIGLWAIQYQGFPLVFSFQNIGQNCGAIAQKAVAVLGQVVYWMSDHGFFQLTGGGPQQMPCPVWDVVYKNLDEANSDKCLAGTNYHYSEVYFFYPSRNGSNGEIDSYAKLNVQEGEWDFGPASTGTPDAPGTPNPYSRTAWTDQNQPGHPISVDLAGILQQADQGFTQNGGATMPASIRSGYADIAEGGLLMSVDQFLPDFLWDGPNPSLEITFFFREWPGDDPTVMGPFTITPTTEYVTLRSEHTIDVGGTEVTIFPAIRGREVALQLDTISGWHRYGNPRLRAAPAGTI